MDRGDLRHQERDEVAAQADAVQVDPRTIDVGQIPHELDDREPVVDGGCARAGRRDVHRVPVPAAVVADHDHESFLEEALPDRPAVVTPRRRLSG
jgi:hypothetical protein